MSVEKRVRAYLELEVLGDELRAVVRDDARVLVGMGLVGTHQDALDIGLGHLPADLAVFFRIGPHGAALSWRSAIIGAAVAASIWSAASCLLSVAHIHEGRVYGTAAGLVVILLWFYLGAVAALVGASVSAEMQQRSLATGRAALSPGARPSRAPTVAE